MFPNICDNKVLLKYLFISNLEHFLSANLELLSAHSRCIVRVKDLVLRITRHVCTYLDTLPWCVTKYIDEITYFLQFFINFWTFYIIVYMPTYAWLPH